MEKHKCQVCKKVFVDLRMCSRHFFKVHFPKSDNDARKTIAKEKKTMVQMKEELQETPITSPPRIDIKKKKACPICGKFYTSDWDLAFHCMGQHFGAKFTCGYCGDEFDKNQNLRNHLERASVCKKIRKDIVEGNGPSRPIQSDYKEKTFVKNYDIIIGIKKMFKLHKFPIAELTSEQIEQGFCPEVSDETKNILINDLYRACAQKSKDQDSVLVEIQLALASVYVHAYKSALGYHLKNLPRSDFIEYGLVEEDSSGVEEQKPAPAGPSSMDLLIRAFYIVLPEAADGAPPNDKPENQQKNSATQQLQQPIPPVSVEAVDGAPPNDKPESKRKDSGKHLIEPPAKIKKQESVVAVSSRFIYNRFINKHLGSGNQSPHCSHSPPNTI